MPFREKHHSLSALKQSKRPAQRLSIRRVPHDRERMIRRYQPAQEPLSKKLGLGHEPDGSRRPRSDQRRIHRADMVGHDDEGTLPGHVIDTAEMKVTRAKKRKCQEPYRVCEDEITQPGLSTCAKPTHHLLKDLMDRLSLSLDDYSIGCWA